MLVFHSRTKGCIDGHILIKPFFFFIDSQNIGNLLPDDEAKWNPGSEESKAKTRKDRKWLWERLCVSGRAVMQFCKTSFKYSKTLNQLSYTDWLDHHSFHDPVLSPYFQPCSATHNYPSKKKEAKERRIKSWVTSRTSLFQRQVSDNVSRSMAFQS